MPMANPRTSSSAIVLAVTVLACVKAPTPPSTEDSAILAAVIHHVSQPGMPATGKLGIRPSELLVSDMSLKPRRFHAPPEPAVQQALDHMMARDGEQHWSALASVRQVRFAPHQEIEAAERAASEMENWAVFRRTFPESACLLVVSRPGYSRDTRTAVVTYRWARGAVDRAYVLCVARRTAEGWTIESCPGGAIS